MLSTSVHSTNEWYYLLQPTFINLIFEWPNKACRCRYQSFVVTKHLRAIQFWVRGARRQDEIDFLYHFCCGLRHSQWSKSPTNALLPKNNYFLFKILANIELGDTDRIAELNRQFYGLHNLYNEILVASRTRQTADERVLQAQFSSRIAFVSSQIQDLDFATHRAIIEHGLRIGNTAAECIIEADTTLQALTDEIGQEIMAIASIARRDFLRIPNEFVHPSIEDIEIQSQSFLSQVMQRLSTGKPHHWWSQHCRRTGSASGRNAKWHLNCPGQYRSWGRPHAATNELCQGGGLPDSWKFFGLLPTGFRCNRCRTRKL